MVTIRWIAVPVSDPDSVPRPVIDVPVRLRLAVPDSVVPDCVISSEICPGPEESVAVPFHGPATFTAAEGAAGASEPPPPPHAIADAAATSASEHWTARNAFID